MKTLALLTMLTLPHYVKSVKTNEGYSVVTADRAWDGLTALEKDSLIEILNN